MEMVSSCSSERDGSELLENGESRGDNSPIAPSWDIGVDNE